MKKTSDKFIEEASENVKKDRKRLEDLFDSVVSVAEKNSQEMGAAIFSENLVKIADSLTKQNVLVVELAKLKQKSEEKTKEESTWKDEDSDEFYSVMSDMDESARKKTKEEKN